ncbi:PD-(D/E)XK nuclease family protein [Fervidibacter sacchari]
MSMLSVPAKELGWLVRDDFCPRCFWLLQKHKIPEGTLYETRFIRFINQFDRFVKGVISNSVHQDKELPDWLYNPLRQVLPNLPQVQKVIEPSLWEAEVRGFRLTGRADTLWQLEDGTFIIADYKLSQPGGVFQKFYEAQLNAYAFLASRQSPPIKVSHLLLIYFSLDEQGYVPSWGSANFPFQCSVVSVDIWDYRDVEELVERAGKLLSLPSPPNPAPNCNRCGENLTIWAQQLVAYLETLD